MAEPPAAAPATRLRRLWGRPPVVVLAYALLTLAATVAVVGPDALAWSDGFIAWSRDLPVEGLPPGDHLQMTYYLWLWEHALTTGSHLPWEDPFQFAASGEVTRQPFGWPLVLVSLPVGLVAGAVAAYNTLVVAAFVAAALATAGLARVLGTSRSAAAVAGFAYAFAPFRLVQGTAHVNALLAFLLPLTLVFVERALHGDERRARRCGWAAAVCHVSLLAAGELHLAVFAAALVPAYVLVRLPGVTGARLRLLVLPAVALAVGTAVVAGLQWAFVLEPSVAGGGRTIEEAASFGPRLGDLWRRSVDWDTFERYAYPSLAVVVLAVAGAVAALRGGGRRLLGLGLLACAVVVTGFSLLPGLVGHPWLQDVYRAVPLLSFSRVPGRILIVSALCLAVLAAFAVDAVRDGRWRVALAGAAAAAILLDAPSGLFERNGAGPTALDDVATGTNVVHLPPFDPGDYAGSVYTFLLTRSQGPRLNGYSPFVTPAAEGELRATADLVAVPVDACRWAEVARDHGVEQVAVHLPLFGSAPVQRDVDGEALVAALDDEPGFERVAEAGGVVRYRLDPGALTCG